MAQIKINNGCMCYRNVMAVVVVDSYSKSIWCNVIFIARYSYKFYSNLHEEIGVARQGPYKYWIELLLLIILRFSLSNYHSHKLIRRKFYDDNHQNILPPILTSRHLFMVLHGTNPHVELTFDEFPEITTITLPTNLFNRPLLPNLLK